MLELYTSMTPLSPLHVVQMTVDSPFLKQNISQDIRQQSTIRPTRYKRVILFKMMENEHSFEPPKLFCLSVVSISLSPFDSISLVENPTSLFLYD